MGQHEALLTKFVLARLFVYQLHTHARDLILEMHSIRLARRHGDICQLRLESEPTKQTVGLRQEWVC